MNGIQNGKDRNLQKTHPGCLGRMVNLFDLSTGVAGHRLLTEKPHDGSSLTRSRSDVTRMLSPIGDPIEDKLIVSELSKNSSSKKSSGTPMKMLIAQEMSKEMESKHNPPNVVAKLMGLDALPQKLPDSATQRSHSKSHTRNTQSHSGIPLESWQQEHDFSDKRMKREVHQYQEQNGYKDVHEIWQKSQKTNHLRDKSPQKGRYNKDIDEKKMALVRQKFMEAKRLSTDEKLRQSKEFQDALEVLSSNKDLFLKFLQEPNSLLSRHLYELQSIPPPPETKRITVLKPSKMMEGSKCAEPVKKIDKQIKKLGQMGQSNGWHQTNPGFSPTFVNWKANDSPSQPTRIVVLKPSPGITHDIMAVVSPPPSSPRTLAGEDFYEETEDDEARESREVGKEIGENLSGHRRDETLLSSVFSNGYIGDESSFDKSENEYVAGNLSDSEVMSPTSRHSWDYINRFGSPYSCSSFSRASYSPESSVCREAKKRLSERWALMALNGNPQEQRHVRRSSSTLGEMLALSDTKKSPRSEKEECSNKEQEVGGSTSSQMCNINKDEMVDDSPRNNLLRSKSVPVSSTVYGTRLNVEVSGPEVDKPKELTKAKSMKLSFKGKVSSLFFSKNRKSSKEKSNSPPSKEESQVATPGKIIDDVPDCSKEGNFEECSKRGIVSHEKGVMPNENQEQPSPISVLEPPFEEDDNMFDNVKPEVPPHSLRSNLIDKSPPIESISRTLSWNNSCSETATPAYPLKQPSLVSTTADEEQDWLFFIQTLLSEAGLDGEIQSDTFFARWHSPESPLDPSLREKYIETNEPNEGKRRQRRSNCKLVFDCVNAALVDMTGYDGRSEMNVRAIPRNKGGLPITVDRVWGRMKEWFSREVRCVLGGDEEINSLVFEGMVRKEVVGKGWGDDMRMEIDNVEKEIEKKLLEELMEEAVVELTGRV